MTKFVIDEGHNRFVAYSKDETDAAIEAGQIAGVIDDSIVSLTKTWSSKKLDDFKNWKTSTTSFVHACSLIGIYAGIGSVLDNLKTDISSYTGNSINTRVDSTQGPVYFMWFGKASDNYFTGILLSYFGNDEPTRKAVMFSYFNGTYQVRLL